MPLSLTGLSVFACVDFRTEEEKQAIAESFKSPLKNSVANLNGKAAPFSPLHFGKKVRVWLLSAGF